MPEYVQTDANGRIINKWYSVDRSVVLGLPDIYEIPRDTFNSLTKFHIVDNGRIREMTQAEKDALLAEEAQEITINPLRFIAWLNKLEELKWVDIFLDQGFLPTMVSR